jgi:hypothetical protein
MNPSRRGEQTWIDAAADRFEREWNTGPDRPRIEDCLAGGDHIASGFDNPYKLRHDERLEPLRQRNDFQKLVEGLEARLASKAEK